MGLDLVLLAEKLRKYRDQFQITQDELSNSTGISVGRLNNFEAQFEIPTGDEILIISDFYKCDYKFFVSNERKTVYERTELLFRKYGNHLSKSDRMAIQEVLYLAECEEFLFKELQINKYRKFSYKKEGSYFKQHGLNAAESLRTFLGYANNEIPINVYNDFRLIGNHIFRRKLINSKISGIFIKHPLAGNCILINYNEDVYRQRFTVAHEVGHSILDEDADINISFHSWDKNDLKEIRANTFASSFLLPPEFLKRIPKPNDWNENKLLEWSKKLNVNVQTLIFALKSLKMVNKDEINRYFELKIPSDEKADPELGTNLSKNERERKKSFLNLGFPLNMSIIVLKHIERG